MSHIFRELREIPIPKEAHVSKHDGRVYLLGSKAGGKKAASRHVIGIATSETNMHVNTQFKLMYPNLWKQYYGSNFKTKNELHCGLYTIALSILSSNGLYDILIDTYGPMYANAAIDFALYSIKCNSCVAEIFTEKMQDEILFSDSIYSDSWYSNFFNKNMPENNNISMRKSWLKKCKENGTKSAWISIDGSSNLSYSTNSDYVEKGHSKNNKEESIISFIYAVDAITGKPLTYNINHGSVVDIKAFNRIVQELKDFKIDVKGIILDRIFASDEVITDLEKCNYNYVIMLKENLIGHVEMVKDHSNIKWKMSNAIHKESTFAISDIKSVFKDSEHIGYINLYYDGINSSERSSVFCSKLLRTFDEIKNNLKNNKKINIPNDLSSYFKISNVGSTTIVEFNDDECFKEIEKKGFYSILSSEDYGAEEVNRIYHLRDSSEKQFRTMKSQLGFDSTHVYSTSSILAKYAICFIASIIRNEISYTCKKLDQKTNEIISRLDRVKIVLSEDLYIPILDLRNDIKLLFKNLGLSQYSLFYIADEYNHRLTDPIVSQKRIIKDLHFQNHSHDDNNQNKVHVSSKNVGRPAGSRNKIKIQRENLINTIIALLIKRLFLLKKTNDPKAIEVILSCIKVLQSRSSDLSSRKKIGRKPRSCNKKTIAVRQSLVNTLAKILIKKCGKHPILSTVSHIDSVDDQRLSTFSSKRGRKKGSRGKKSLERERLIITLVCILVNKIFILMEQNYEKNKEEIEIALETLSTPIKKKQCRGRKLGSLNKKTIAIRQSLLSTLHEILNLKKKNQK